MIDCPGYVETALLFLAEVYEHKYNVSRSAFRNSGQSFSNSTFSVSAYDWDSPTNTPNFKHGIFEIYWYKYVGRGMKMNREMSLLQCWIMLKDCVASLI